MKHGDVAASSERGLAGPRAVGVVSLVLGVKDVAYAAMSDSSVVLLTPNGGGVLAGILAPVVRTNGTGFRIVSSVLTDTAGVGYAVFEP